MALIKTYDFNGIEITNAYHVVGYVKYSKIDNKVTFRLDSFINEAKRNEDSRQSFVTTGYEFEPSGSHSTVGNDVSTACYNYLKSLTEWSGSVDV